MTTKKALLIGINYTSIPRATLRGCIHDIVNMSQMLVDGLDYDLQNIIELRDDINDPAKRPTRDNIINNLKNLVNESDKLTEIWFHYSGHGSQIKNINNTETDNLDEVIVPIDFQQKGFIVDDEIFNIISNVKCKMILLFDSCHSGSMCDLQWSFEFKNGSFLKSLNTNKIISNPNIFCFSGCKDAQTSADAYSTYEQQNVGAFTDAFLHCLRVNHINVDILKLYGDICKYITTEKFSQIPIFSSSVVTPNYRFTRYNSTPIAININPIIDEIVLPTFKPSPAPPVRKTTKIITNPYPINSLFSSVFSNKQTTNIPFVTFPIPKKMSLYTPLNMR